MIDDLSLALAYLALFFGAALAFWTARKTPVNRVIVALLGGLVGLLSVFVSPLLLGRTLPWIDDDWFGAAVVIWSLLAVGCGALGAFLGRAERLRASRRGKL